MPEIEFRPIKKIVILEELKYTSTKDLFVAAVAGKPPDVPVMLLWAEGVVFIHSVIPLDSEEIIKNRIQGTVYWVYVGYAKMDGYKEEINVGLHTIKIIKVTSPELIDVVKKLGERL